MGGEQGGFRVARKPRVYRAAVVATWCIAVHAANCAEDAAAACIRAVAFRTTSAFAELHCAIGLSDRRWLRGDVVTCTAGGKNAVSVLGSTT